MSDKKKSTVKDSIASALGVTTGSTDSVGVGVSIPKDVWENLITELRARRINIKITADGPKVIELEVEDR
jgi:hypothetical protein